jgi:ribosomal-protein-alanine N-acetyltransferase
MTTAIFTRGIICELHVIKRQSITAFKLTIGSLITRRWIKISDMYVDNISGEMLSNVIRLYNENFIEINEKRFSRYIHLFNKTTYVYTDHNEVKGYCLYFITPSISSGRLKKTATLYSFTVDARCRGQGIGVRLLQKSILEMKLNSIDSVILYVAKDNEPAINLYQKVGFEITEEKRDICGLGKECYKMEIAFDEDIKMIFY